MPVMGFDRFVRTCSWNFFNTENRLLTWFASGDCDTERISALEKFESHQCVAYAHHKLPLHVGYASESAAFPESRAKNKLCKVWRAVLVFQQQFLSICCL